MEWKYVKDTDNNFMVNEDGVIKRLYFETIGKDGKIYKHYEKIITPHNSKSSPYLRVNLTSYKREYVHRIVAEAFLDLPENYKELQVNHIDGDKENNNYQNLEWVTCKENMEHASRTNLINRSSKKRKDQAPINARKGSTKIKEKAKQKRAIKYGEIAFFDKDGEIIKVFNNVDEASEDTGYSLDVIVPQVKLGKRKFHNKTYFRKVTN